MPNKNTKPLGTHFVRIDITITPAQKAWVTTKTRKEFNLSKEVRILIADFMEMEATS